MSERVNVLFNEIEQKYDYIIVDTAPVGIVTDTLLDLLILLFMWLERINYQENVKCTSRLNK